YRDDDATHDKVLIRPRGGKPRSATLRAMQWTGGWGTLAEFADCVQTGREPETSGRDNLGTIAMMDAAVQSSARREPVAIARAAAPVTIWNEHVHERRDQAVGRLYPDGMHGAIAAGLTRELGAGVKIRVATLDEPDHGLTDEVLAATDVLTWWGHAAHEKVADAVVDRVQARVLEGMGILILHSGHYSKIFKRLMGTTCALRWRQDPGGERELIWTVNPGHPIAAGLPQPIVIEHQEMYGEFFDIPPPDALV